MKFEDALDCLRKERRLTRISWNGPGQYVYLVGPGRYPPSTPAGREIAALAGDGLVSYRPYFALHTVQKDVVPWQPTQSDLLAEDWDIVG